MKTKEELKNTFIRYQPEITKDVFKRIIDRIEQLGFTQYSICNNYEDFVSNNLVLSSEYTWYIVNEYGMNKRPEIEVSDILGDGWRDVKWSVDRYVALEEWAKEGQIKWSATLPEAEAFSKSLLESEESKTLSVDDLIEGEIYYCKGGQSHIFKYKTGNDIVSESKFLKYNNLNINNCGGLRLATLEEKKWLLTCIKQDKFIPQDQLNMYDSEGNLIENKPKPKQFEFNKWYKRIEPEYSKILIFIYDNGYYGFNLDGKWFKAPYFDYSKSDKERLIPATIEEVEERFISYAKEKYPIGTKFNSTGGNKDCVIYENSSYSLDVDGDILVKNSKNKFIGRLFSRSILEWAEIIEEDVSVINQPIESKLNMKEEIVKFKSGDKIVGSAVSRSIIHSSKYSSCNPLGIPDKYFVPDKVEYISDNRIKLWSNGTYWECYLKDISLYKEEEKYKNKYVKYNKTFTEDMFNYMLDWAKKQNYPYPPYDYCANTFDNFKTKGYFWFGCRDGYSYGVDNNPQDFDEITFEELFPEYNKPGRLDADIKPSERWRQSYIEDVTVELIDVPDI